MKYLKVLTLSFIMIFCVGCAEISTEIINENRDCYPYKFVFINTYSAFTFYYQQDTKVMYVVNREHGGITPLYNPDGSLMIYDEWNN